MVRYGLEGWLAVYYGRRILRLWSAELEKWSMTILWTFVALTVAGVAFGLWKLLRNKRSPGRRKGTQPSPRPSPAN